jgi:pimeloyl-ACP methyl ester carboxylesterase
MSFLTSLSKLTLVNIGTHSLALYAYGPEPSSSNDPAVLFVSGVASSSLVWAAVIRLLPPSLRSCTYDRFGCGHSELSPFAPMAENIALKLSHLIEKAPISNPLILVGHSWAGVLLNELIILPRNGPHIDGLVLVDANHETALQVPNPNNVNLQDVSAGLEAYSAWGTGAEHKLTP